MIVLHLYIGYEVEGDYYEFSFGYPPIRSRILHQQYIYMQFDVPEIQKPVKRLSKISLDRPLSSFEKKCLFSILQNKNPLLINKLVNPRVMSESCKSLQFLDSDVLKMLVSNDSAEDCLIKKSEILPITDYKLRIFDKSSKSIDVASFEFFDIFSIKQLQNLGFDPWLFNTPQ